MGFDFLNGLKGGAGGAAAGSPFGAPGVAIGGAAGALLGLFGGGSDDEANQYRQQMMDLWNQRLNELNNPDANESDTLNRLHGLTQTGLTPEARAGFLQAQLQANELARGRQGAIAADMAARGGGVANSGQNAVLQAQSAQDAAQRAQLADTQQAAYAAGAQRDSIAQYLAQRARNEQMKIQATQGMAGATKNAQDLAQEQHYAQSGNLDNILNAGGKAAASYMAAQKMPGTSTSATPPVRGSSVSDYTGLPNNPPPHGSSVSDYTNLPSYPAMTPTTDAPAFSSAMPQYDPTYSPFGMGGMPQVSQKPQYTMAPRNRSGDGSYGGGF